MYSQNDEEAHILEWFAGKTGGRFLDIGAYDGKTFSNTRALFELMEWSGVLVEPACGPFRALMQLYQHNPRATLANAAISGASCGFMTFWQNDDAISTANAAHREKWAVRAAYTETHVYMLSLEKFLASFPGPYDFVNIDVEGGNVELFRALITRELGASLLCIEYDAGSEEILKLAAGRGYLEIHRTGENILLGRK